jgi:hypothetical protein
MGLSYDELCKFVNDAHRGNPDIRIRTLAHDLGVPFDIVWECLGFRKRFNSAVCWDISRIGRSMKELILFLSDMKDRGIGICSVIAQQFNLP